jgi:peptidoglycan/LPS O-acetylase OafA/YrhL
MQRGKHMPSNDVQRSEVFTALNGLRFLAALAVVCYHYARRTDGFAGYPRAIQSLIECGPAVVGFFFVLSGFVLAHRYLQDGSKDQTKAAFYWARFARIYPAYILAFLLFFPGAVEKYIMHPTPGTGGPATFVLSAGLYCLMLQAWTPLAQSWNGPSWSLSVEAFMYLIFPFIGYRLRALTGRATVLIALAAWSVPVGVVSLYELGFISQHTWQSYLTNNPLLWTPLFVMGICAVKFLPAWNRVGLRTAAAISTAGLAVLLGLAAIWPAAAIDIFISGGVAPLLVAVVVFFSRSTGGIAKIIGGEIFNTLGKASYVLYIIHAPVWHYWQMAMDYITRTRPLPSATPSWQFWLFVPVLVFISLVVERFVEAPTRVWLSGLGRPRLPAPAAIPALLIVREEIRESAWARFTLDHQDEFDERKRMKTAFPQPQQRFAPPDPQVEVYLADREAGVPERRGVGKPRVLILPNVASWIVGQMAMHIMERFKDSYEFWILTDKVIRLRPDLVQALIPGLDFIFPLTDKSYKLLRAAAGPIPLPPSIFWLHHITKWNPSILAAANDASELIACTSDWKAEIEKECPGPTITVVPHGVDADFFHRVERKRAKFEMPEDAFVVGFIGNKTSNYDFGRKGLDVLETVMRDTRRSVPNLHVCFLGLGWDEEVRQFQEQGISANYTGFIPQSQLPAFYSSIDVHIVTSRIEGGPVTVLEAMACETPVLTTRVGLVPQTIADGKNGFSVEIGDTDGLTRHLCELSKSAEFRRDMGVAARESVYPHMSWHEVLGILEEPLARMEARSPRTANSTSLASAKTAARLVGAVHTMDGLLWGFMSWWEGLMTPAVASRMVKACWEGYNAADILRGVGLITRTSFRRASLPKEKVA